MVGYIRLWVNEEVLDGGFERFGFGLLTDMFEFGSRNILSLLIFLIPEEASFLHIRYYEK